MNVINMSLADTVWLAVARADEAGQARAAQELYTALVRFCRHVKIADSDVEDIVTAVVLRAMCALKAGNRDIPNAVAFLRYVYASARREIRKSYRRGSLSVPACDEQIFADPFTLYEARMYLPVSVKAYTATYPHHTIPPFSNLFAFVASYFSECLDRFRRLAFAKRPDNPVR